RGAAENGGRMEKKQISRAGEPGMRRRVRARGSEDHARGPHQSGEDEQDAESHTLFVPQVSALHAAQARFTPPTTAVVTAASSAGIAMATKMPAVDKPASTSEPTTS